MQQDMFSLAGEAEQQQHRPLADRMRPETIQDILGQEHILAEGKLLRRAIDADRLTSLIFFGPPGCGKTTIARVIANTTARSFAQLNAVTDGLAELRKVLATAQEQLNLYGKQTILFIDEIHRFNKAQQDGLLPAVEKGLVILIGATTQNPYFSLNPALLSRSMIFELKPLNDSAVQDLLKRALQDLTYGLGAFETQIDDEALAHFIRYAGGDVRSALNALELAVLSTIPDAKGIRHIDIQIAEESIQRPQVVYDATGDEHYDVISAFIKSVRGSDVNAALYYLARMIDAGEDPLFIARRLVILSAEDIGQAEPYGICVAQSAADALQLVGMPEGRIILAHATVYLARAPKSNAAYMGVDQALSDIRQGELGSVPNHLRDSHYAGAKKIGRGIGYQYPHDFPNHHIEQSYLPENLRNKIYYQDDDTVKRKDGFHG